MKEKKQQPSPWGFHDLMVIAAFRYCCGRQTYIVGTCADWLIEQWPNFANNAKAVIQRDLEEEFNRDDEAREDGKDYKPLGHDCDRAEWKRVRELWANAELRRAADEL